MTEILAIKRNIKLRLLCFITNKTIILSGLTKKYFVVQVF